MKNGLANVAVRTLSLAVMTTVSLPALARAQSLVDPALTVSTVVSGLAQPVAMAFIGPNDILVTEKASGQVKRITDGVFTDVVLDLAVNSNSERGLLGIALHPEFPAVPWVYLYNTESTTGQDSTVAAEVPLLGNRVDRFVWNGSALTFDRNIIRLRSFQNDHNNVANPAAEVLRGNHNGGVLRFGPDGKLYVIIGDNGRRGWTQNNLAGPVPDDDFGGPEPDDAHLTGVILRLNDDGSTPEDNPFFDSARRIGRRVEGALGEEVGDNLQRVFGYGVRNSFGMTFDPKSGDLWTTENGGRAFDEVNRVERGFNGGWIQFMGPLSRVAEFKEIEVGVGVGQTGPVGLQQVRFPATNIADTPALQRVMVLERLLQLVELAVGAGERLHGLHLAALGLHRERQARAHRGAVDLHGAAAADAVLAADMGAGRAERMAQEVAAAACAARSRPTSCGR